MRRALAVMIATSGILWQHAAKSDEWPPLPTKGFISGRAATLDDIKNGDALFVAAAGNQSVGHPITVKIPQYVYLKGTPKVKGILVQAEETQGIKAYGVRTLDGSEQVVTEPEVELLGTDRPN